MWFQIVSGSIVSGLTVIRRFGGDFRGGPTCDNLDSRCVACIDHCLKLGSVTALGGELVGNRLIIGPPLGTLDVLLRRAHFAGTGE